MGFITFGVPGGTSGTYDALEGKVVKIMDTKVPTIDKDPEMLKAYQEMLMATDVISNNDYMFKG